MQADGKILAVGQFDTIEDVDAFGTGYELTRFNPDAKYATDQFRQAVVAQIGSSKAVPMHMGDTTIYETTGKQQEISVWFQNRYLFVLSVRSDFAHPRTLLRQLTGVRP